MSVQCIHRDGTLVPLFLVLVPCLPVNAWQWFTSLCSQGIHESLDSTVKHALLPLQYDLGFTNEEVEANVTTYYRAFDESTTLNSLSVPSAVALDSKEQEITSLAYLDAIVCIACFVLALIARSAQQLQAEAANKEALTIASYTIQVQGLPPDATSQQVCSTLQQQTYL